EPSRTPQSVTTATPDPAATTFDQAWDAVARQSSTTVDIPSVEQPQPTRIAPADPLQGRYRDEYRRLTDEQLEARLRQLRRGAGRTQLDADVSFQRDAARGFTNSGDVIAGTRSSTSGMHAR